MREDQRLRESLSPEEYRNLLGLARAEGFPSLSSFLVMRIRQLLEQVPEAGAETNGWRN
jgi:hypothetical protein